MSDDRRWGRGPDREVRRRLRRAYAEAWAIRVSTEDRGEDVLTERLRAHHLTEVLDELSAIHQHVFHLWRRGVPPQRLDREGWNLAGRAALQLIESGRLIYRQFQKTSEEPLAEEDDNYLLEELPEGTRAVTDHLREPASAMLTFEPSGSGEATLREWCRRGSGDLRGWHRPAVWFDMDPDDALAHVAIGRKVIGEARVPVLIWRRMQEAARDGLYAAGFLEVRLRRGEIETGTLLCMYVDDPRGPLWSDPDASS
jgi:hypothetical protein